MTAHALRGAAARGLSDGALALITSVGLIGVTGIGLYARGLWRIGLVFVVMSAFGALGIFDRSAIRPRWLFRTARTSAAIVGWLAAFALLFVVFEFALHNLKQ
jgi:hypothetical protein